MSSLKTVVINIGGRVSNRDRAVSTGTDVLLHIARYGLDPWSSHAGLDVVNIFISREEQKCVVVFLELIDCGKDILQVDMVVRLSWLVLSDRVFWGVDIQREVDTSILQRTHASIVVLAVVDGVDSDGVDV